MSMTVSEFLFCFACIPCDVFLEEKTKIEEPQQKFVYYFAYGSTMNKQSLEEKIGRVQFVSKATLLGFQLNFAGPRPFGSARATLIPHSQCSVEGAVYKITQTQLAQLDYAKENNEASQRLKVLVKKDDLSPPITVELHVLDQQDKIFFHAPTHSYLLKMINGAKQIEVSEKYLNIVERYAFSIQRRSKL